MVRFWRSFYLNRARNRVISAAVQQQQWTHWTFRMRRGREWCYSQPNYLLGNKRINKRLRKVALCLPRYHDSDSDHRAVIATFWGGSLRWLKSYQRDQQRFPLQLFQGEETEQTKMFSHLVAECIKPKLRKRQGNDWISDKTWALVRQRMALWQVRKMSCTEGRRTNVSSGLPSTMIGRHA